MQESKQAALEAAPKTALEAAHEITTDPPPGILMLVAWDEKSQSVGLRFRADEFTNWDFVVGILQMAAEQAKVNGNMARAQAMQQNAMASMQQQYQEAKIRENLRRNGGQPR